MSPGPASYKLQDIFSSPPKSPISPRSIAVRSSSLKSSCLLRKNSFMSPKSKKSQDPQLDEIYRKLVHTVKIELTDLAKGFFEGLI